MSLTQTQFDEIVFAAEQYYIIILHDICVEKLSDRTKDLYKVNYSACYNAVKTANGGIYGAHISYDPISDELLFPKNESQFSIDGRSAQTIGQNKERFDSIITERVKAFCKRLNAEHKTNYSYQKQSNSNARLLKYICYEEKVFAIAFPLLLVGIRCLQKKVDSSIFTFLSTAATAYLFYNEIERVRFNSKFFILREARFAPDIANQVLKVTPLL